MKMQILDMYYFILNSVPHFVQTKKKHKQIPKKLLKCNEIIRENIFLLSIYRTQMLSYDL